MFCMKNLTSCQNNLLLKFAILTLKKLRDLMTPSETFWEMDLSFQLMKLTSSWTKVRAIFSHLLIVRSRLFSNKWTVPYWANSMIPLRKIALARLETGGRLKRIRLRNSMSNPRNQLWSSWMSSQELSSLRASQPVILWSLLVMMNSSMKSL